ncbi:heterogeneous nuclear ribonucleoprotein Q-like isoform X6 [Homarus americanus]|nr:heterogeneous nuclear ribonucleoprotein Q-like isoform X6 [Homarus americanus]XP_042236501.1 heterogeneous nuclear ribonucleoprotein Q-like isoform X6 [Homarus americanus]XP_042236502.1 heterogeneous nuclear ribonucleoprotein Q-like isoform X6 [Homarus americanus]XP_042236503.1 heterogeneous nuclear ribonucleoprotein Q-like isoform X6 [Homarus americanus]XP_042236504.1 heterogeneous nuclear ribonucleoprotein Q-like isoform X6 [Homarus americanus]XP_042236505.1 heterogeneous nuclear ribonucl
MAEGNGGGDPGSQIDGERTEDYQKLINYGLNEKVAAKLDEIYKQGKLRHEDLDERALDALKEFPVEGAVTVLKQFLESNLEHVSNKSAYLCGVMKTYRQRKQYNTDSMAVNPGKGPNEENLKAILERSGYTLDVTTGQRKYGGPPPNWEGPPPGPGCEVFCGKIPKELYEDELIPLFEKCGEIWDLRLMMDPMTGQNRGYAFITFTTRSAANEAVRQESSCLLQLNEYEIQRGKKLGVTISYNNHRLFVGNIPKNRERHELYEEFAKHAPGLVEVIIYSSPDDKKKNRGFCFLEYESHKAASLAKRRLSSGRFKVWGCEIIVDWADPQEEPDEDTMSKVKVLYVRNLTQMTTEEMLKEKFDEFGKVERVKKIKDYAFVHFEERDEAVKAMDALQGKDLGGANMEISLAKPPSDKKKKEEVLRNREKRLMQMLAQRGIAETDPHTGQRMPVPPAMLRGGRGGGRGGGRSDYDYDYDYYGYGDYQGGYSDPYYDDYYRYEDYYYDYSPYPMGRGRTKSVPAGRGYGMANRGRGAVPSPRGGRGMVPRGGAMGGRMTRPPRAGQGFRGSARGANLAGKRKLDGGHQNEGDSKRRFQNTGASWGNQPIPQQPLSSYSGANGSKYGGAGGDQQWYHDSYPQSWS